MVDCERTERAAGTDAKNIYAKFVELRDNGILCDLKFSYFLGSVDNNGTGWTSLPLLC